MPGLSIGPDDSEEDEDSRVKHHEETSKLLATIFQIRQYRRSRKNIGLEIFH